MNIGVIGAGSWGTALATVLCDNGHDVTLWSYRQSQIDELNDTRINSSKLPGVVLPDELQFTADMENVVTQNEVLVLAVPSKATRQTLEDMKPYIRKNQGVVSVSKGIERDTLFTQSEIIEDLLSDVRVGVLSGPSHAEEVVNRMPTLVVCGSHDKEFALALQEAFMNENFRVYTSPDVVGIEIGGASKNVIALAAGISDGLGYGDNSKAALITRGISEITRLGVKMGADQVTFAGLSGIGDLIVTCESKHSRNRRAGVLIGEGMTPQEAMTQVDMVVEGVYAARSAKKLAGIHGEELPIVNEVVKVLFENKDPAEAVKDLMIRDTVLENRGQDF